MHPLLENKTAVSYAAGGAIGGTVVNLSAGSITD